MTKENKCNCANQKSCYEKKSCKGKFFLGAAIGAALGALASKIISTKNVNPQEGEEDDFDKGEMEVEEIASTDESSKADKSDKNSAPAKSSKSE